MSKHHSFTVGVALAVLVQFSGALAQDALAEQPGYRASLYPSVWPADMANLNRSNAIVNAGLPRDARAEDIAVETVEMPFPVFSYIRNDDKVFVIGGTPFFLDRYVAATDGQRRGRNTAEAHITRYNPQTGEQIRLPLDRGNTLAYVGGALMHANGFVYAISQSHLYRIDADTMTIVNSADLPTVPFPRARSTIYNGLSVGRDGYLLTKYFSPISDVSEFLVIDPDTLEVVSSTSYPGASPRLALSEFEGQEYLYHLNTSETFRMRLDGTDLSIDESWLSRYDTGAPENEEPTSPVIVGERAHYTTNTSFNAPEPMMIFWQSVADSYPPAGEPLRGQALFESAEDGGFSFFHLSIDAVTGIIIGNDQGNGLLAAVRITAEGSLERQWERAYRVSARPMIVSDRQMVYATDYQDGRNHLIVLDLTSGEELFRVPTPATRATIATIVAGTNNEVYFGSNEPGEEVGLYHRIFVKGQ